MKNVHAPVHHPDSTLFVTSPVERSRLFELNRDPRVVQVRRAEGFALTDPDTGERYYYSPAFQVTYRGGRVEYEEVPSGSAPPTLYQQRKAAVARAYLQASTGNRNASYRVLAGYQ